MTRAYRKQRPALADGSRFCHDHDDGRGAYLHPEAFGVYRDGARSSYCRVCKNARDALAHARRFAADPTLYARLMESSTRHQRAARRRRRVERRSLADLALRLVDRGVLPSDAELARRLGLALSTTYRWRYDPHRAPSNPTVHRIVDLIMELSK